MIFFNVGSHILTPLIQIKINSLLKKKHAKRIINIFILLNQIKVALKQKIPISIFFYNLYILNILTILKSYNFIFGFERVKILDVSIVKFPYYIPQFLISRLVCIYLKSSFYVGTALLNICLISTPSRFIYISYKQLLRLVKFQLIYTIYLLNTVYGIVTHYQALKYKIGGNLLLRIN